MIARLSDLLRASMKGADAPEVTLTAELDMLMDYVEILQTRFQDRLRFDLDVHPDTAEALVPAFLLQPLVENAVRHGIAQKTRVSARGTHNGSSVSDKRPRLRLRPPLMRRPLWVESNRQSAGSRLRRCWICEWYRQ